MKLDHYLLLSALFLSNGLMAQISVGGTPYSTLADLPAKGMNQVAPVEFNAPVVAQEDAQRELDGDLPLYGRQLPLNLDLRSAGTWTVLPNGDQIGRIRITSVGALATELFFSQFSIPLGGVVYVYDPEKTQVLGGFTGFNEAKDGSFTTALINGETSILEYYEPAESAGRGRVMISQVGHAYRMVAGAEKADPCQVDVNCSEGANWLPQRDGSVRISVVSAQGLGWCSGTVVNNTSEDCAPYVLSAFHCADASTASHFNSFKFYFRFQRSGCATGPAFSSMSMTGCVKKADSQITSSNDGSDFLLLEINNDIPDNYTPFFAGWNAAGQITQTGVSIHHPAGDEKKISTYTNAPTNTTWIQPSPSNAHLRVYWVATPNGHGVTEGGSSGSPLFNSDHEVIGTLTGGASYCNTTVPNGQFQPDVYGKMSYHWLSNGTANNKRLKPWMDPANTGVMEMDGSYDPCGMYTVYVGIEVPADQLGDLNLFPNPTYSELHLTMSSELMEVARSVQITDMTGRVVFQKRISSLVDMTLDMSEFSPGTYTVQLLGAVGELLRTDQVVRMN